MDVTDLPYGYVIDTRIRDKYHTGFDRKDSAVSHFIVHGTAGGSKAEDCLKWMIRGGDMGGGNFRKDDYKRGIALFQYMIDRDGKIIELISPHKWVYHSSTGSFDAMTIGAELINPDRNNGGGYTDMQYKSLAMLYKFLNERFGNLKIMQGHGAIKKEKTGSSKTCPGKGFAWMKLNSLLIDNMFHTVYNSGNERIEIL
jgi:hypothetical protein